MIMDTIHQRLDAMSKEIGIARKVKSDVCRNVINLDNKMKDVGQELLVILRKFVRNNPALYDQCFMDNFDQFKSILNVTNKLNKKAYRVEVEFYCRLDRSMTRQAFMVPYVLLDNPMQYLIDRTTYINDYKRTIEHELRRDKMAKIKQLETELYGISSQLFNR